MRATANVAATLMTKMAGTVPMVDPTAALVTGAKKLTKMMNGIGRMKLTRKLRMK